MRYLAFVVIPALGLAGLIAFITVIFPRIFGQVYAAPTEPIAFDHRVHVQTAGLDCGFCHRLATTSANAGYPDVQQCMFCHSVVGQGIEEIEKVRQAWASQTPIDWVRIHRVPDHVSFVHEAHLRAGFTCATCHGDVQNMGQAMQVRPLNMGDCVNCHRQNSAPTECATCHK
jgi:Cytochrome c7 and related cytochrome c/Class III cytochrome C family